MSILQGPHCTGKTGKIVKKKKKEIPVRENTGNLEILPKHREFVCSSCIFLDPKHTGYLPRNFQTFQFRI